MSMDMDTRMLRELEVKHVQIESFYNHSNPSEFVS